ncbi:hypothetical protein Csa_004128 [Cucumis sativus]|uniref:Uncharacterized protein n=1 Tax=Cucumis sativus TaxID=3659 RepID=A0A0A0KH81_CUCSA|nr:hypothetical protein Csa_004128 [Cucumis sativus]
MNPNHGNETDTPTRFSSQSATQRRGEDSENCNWVEEEEDTEVGTAMDVEKCERLTEIRSMEAMEIPKEVLIWG